MARKSRKNVSEAAVIRSQELNTALYIRLSVEDGHGRSNSVENQQLILNDYLADKPDFKISDTYIDNGLTGTNFDRPGFKRMLADIENGRINCVIVKDLSRLGRNAIDAGYYIEQYFPIHKVRFIAVNDSYDSADKSNPQNSIMLPLKNMVNEAYALDIGRKIRAAAHQSMLAGDFIGARAPFGYKKAPDNCHKLIIDGETAPIVKQIFTWYDEGLGYNTIAVKLNEMNAVTSSVYKSLTSESDKRYRKNAQWTTFTVAHILDNEVYTGDMVQGKSKTVSHKQIDTAPDEYIIVRNTHEPIVSRELFDRVRELRAKTKEQHKSKPLNPYTPNIFKGKVFCAHCGRPLHRCRDRITKSGDVYAFWCLSPSRVSKDACIGIHTYEKDVISAVINEIENKISSLDTSFSDLYGKSDSDKYISDLNKSKLSKQNESSRVQSLIKGLYENLVKGIISENEYADFKRKYEDEVKALNEEIYQISEKMNDYSVQQENFKKVQGCAASFKADRKLTAELISSMIERIEISHDHAINITFHDGGKEMG